MSNSRGCILFFLLWLCGIGAAQEAAPITDTELRAAYCLGGATHQVEIFTARLKAIETAAAAGRMTQALREDRIWTQGGLDVVDERRDRMRKYLEAKGFLTGRNGLKQLLDVMDRGFADSRKCLDNGIDLEAATACPRVKRCIEEFLPF